MQWSLLVEAFSVALSSAIPTLNGGGTAHPYMDLPPCTPPTNGTKPVYMIHIHKAGGTSLCSLAIRSGLCKPPPASTLSDRYSWFSKNCNPTWADKDVASGYAGGPALVAYAQRLHIGFVGNEYAVPQQMPWEAFDVVSLVRDPLQLTLSLCDIAQLGNQSVNQSIPVAKLKRCLAKRDIPDYQVRRYAGCSLPTWGECRASIEKNATAASEDDLGRALKFLARSRLVLLTERLHEAGCLLARALHWSATDTSALRVGADKLAFSTSHSAHSDIPNRVLEAAIAATEPAVLESLRRATALDQRLHEHARKRFHQDLSRCKPPPPLP